MFEHPLCAVIRICAQIQEVISILELLCDPSSTFFAWNSTHHQTKGIMSCHHKKTVRLVRVNRGIKPECQTIVWMSPLELSLNLPKEIEAFKECAVECKRKIKNKKLLLFRKCVLLGDERVWRHCSFSGVYNCTGERGWSETLGKAQLGVNHPQGRHLISLEKKLICNS